MGGKERNMNKLARMVINDRKDSCLSQQEFADLLNISIASVVNIEKSRMLGSKVIKALSTYFALTTKEIRELMLTKQGRR